MASQNNNNMNDINIENDGDIIPKNGANFIKNGEDYVPTSTQQQNGGHSVPSSAAVAVQEQYIINCADLISLNEVLTTIASESKAIPTTEVVEKVGVSDVVGQGSGKDSGFSISPESVSGLQVLVDIMVHNEQGKVIERLSTSKSKLSLISESTASIVHSEDFLSSDSDSSSEDESEGENDHINNFSNVVDHNANRDEKRDHIGVAFEGTKGSQQPNKFKSAKIFLVFLLGLLEFLSGSAMSVLAPFYTTEAQEHGLSVKLSSVVFASVFLLQILCTPVFGRYIATLGSIRLLFLGCLLSGLANIGFGFVQNIKTVELFFIASIVMRCITAVGESAMNVAVYPLARRLSLEEYRTTVLSCMETSFGLGTMSGPFLGGLMYEYGGFTLPFLVCGILLGVTGTLASILIVLLDKAEFASLAREQIAEDNTTGPPRMGATNGPNGPNENDEDNDVPQLRLRKVLQVPGVLMPLMIVVLTGMSCQWYQPILEPYLSSNYNISGFKASLFLIIDGAVYAILSPMIGLFLDKTVSPRLFLIFGCSTISLAFFVLGPFYLAGTPDLIQIGIGLGLHGVGLSANFIGTLSLLTLEMEKINSASVEKATAMATCLWMTAESVGSFFGSLAGGSSYEVWGWDLSCLLNASLQCLGIVLVISYSMVVYAGQKTRKMAREGERKPLLSNNNNTTTYQSV